MKYLGCDLGGNKAYVAAYDTEKPVVDYREITLPSILNTEWILLAGDMFDALIARTGAQSICIEKPWVRINFHPQAALSIVRHTTIVEALCAGGGLSVSFALPQTWRTALYGEGNGTLKTDTAKRVALAWIEENFGLVFKDHNAAEAFCLAVYGARQ